MGLAVPGKILGITGNDPMLRSGRIRFGGAVKLVNLAYVPEARAGDYVNVHVGFALSIVDAEEARRAFDDLKKLHELEELENHEQA